MGANVNTGLTSITGNVDASVVPFGTTPGQDIIRVAMSGNGAVQNAYTVTAGRKLFVYSVGLYGASKTITLYKTDGVTALVLLLNGAAEYFQYMSLTTPIWKYAAGEIVKFYGDAAGCNFYFWGVEVDE